MTILKDKRFTFTKEYCGADRPMYILRYCGEWVEKFENTLALQYIKPCWIYTLNGLLNAVTLPPVFDLYHQHNVVEIRSIDKTKFSFIVPEVRVKSKFKDSEKPEFYAC